MQIALRRQIANYKRQKVAHIWPIDPNSARPPQNWNGWPDGRQFALVLSHNVDNRKGQERVLELAKLEMRLGFRSAFNFVPERYTNHEEIKKFLRQNGYEINIDIWKRKLDWIAAIGGMVLLNTHSDYMNFNGGKLENEEYRVDHYIELLSYVKSVHAGQFWHATPFEIARFVREAYNGISTSSKY